MDPVSLCKALLIQAAYTGASAVCQNTTGGGVPIDPLIKDSGLQGKGVMVYEEAKIQYAALLRAFADKTGIWPDPVVPTVPTNLAVPNLTGLLSQASPLLSALVPLLSTIPGAAPLATALGAILAPPATQHTPDPTPAAPAPTSPTIHAP